MASLLDTRIGVGLSFAAAVAIGAGAVMWLHGAGTHQAAPAAPTPSASAWDGPIGPGALPRGVPMNDTALAQAGMGDQPLTDAGGQLLVDARLHALFDSYLLSAKGAAREARAGELRAWLGRLLTQPALGQADTLATAYLRYLQAEDELRARQRFTRPDPAGLTDAQVDQMVAWQQTRAELRERMLGMTVAQAWFEADDADCKGAFADWRKQHEPADSADVDSNELRARRLHGAVLAERRNDHAQSCASQLMDGLAQQG
jgi:lipase chaperone LimK